MIYDPATSFAEHRTRQPFPGNMIPAEPYQCRLPEAAEVLSARLQLSPSDPEQRVRQSAREQDDDQFGIRVDNSFSTRQTAFAQYIRQRSTIIAPGSDTVLPVRIFPLETDYATAAAYLDTDACADQQLPRRIRAQFRIHVQ